MAGTIPVEAADNTAVQGSLATSKDWRISKQSPAFNATPGARPDPGRDDAMAVLTGAVAVASPVNSAKCQRLLFFWTQDGTGGGQ